MSDNYRFAVKNSQIGGNQERLALDPDLEARLNKIVSAIPNDVKQKVIERYGKSAAMLETPFTTPFTNNTQQNYLNKLNLEDFMPKTTRTQSPTPDLSMYSSPYTTRAREPAYLSGNYPQSISKKKAEETDIHGRSDKKQHNLSIEPTIDNITANMKILNERMERVMQNTQRLLHTPRDGFSDTKEMNYTSPIRRNKLEESSIDFANSYGSDSKNKTFLSGQKFQSPTQANAYRSKEYTSPLSSTKANFNIDEIFNKTMQRSQAIQRQEVDKDDVKQSFQNTKQLLENLGNEESAHKDPLWTALEGTLKSIIAPSVLSSGNKDNKETFENSGSYVGEKLDGQKHGRGTYQAEDGSKYEGEWDRGLRSGYGIQTFSNGEVEYEGEWLKDKYHGTGNLNNRNPQQINEPFDYKDFGKSGNLWMRYDGEFENGKWHGLGTICLSNGEKFSGKFKAGEACGTGTYLQKSGKTIAGEWKGNKFVSEL